MSFDEYGFLGEYGNEIVEYNYENHIEIFKGRDWQEINMVKAS